MRPLIYCSLALAAWDVFAAYLGSTPTFIVILFAVQVFMCGVAAGQAMERKWTLKWRDLAGEAVVLLKRVQAEKQQDSADWWKGGQ